MAASHVPTKASLDLGKNVLGLLAAGLSISLVTAWIAASYFQVDVPGSLIWPGEDGYCNPESQGLGVHCFSDLAMYLGLGPTMDPGGLEASVKFYPPLNRLGFLAFQLLAVHVGYVFAVSLYILLAAISLLLPALWATRTRAPMERLLVIALIGVGTFPFVATLDRGNNIAFAVPVLLAVVVLVQRHQYLAAMLVIAVGSQIKPQIGILAISFLIVRQFAFAIATAGLSVAIFLTSFLVFFVAPGNLSPIQEFKDYVLFTRFFDQYLPLTQLYPINLSFVHLLGVAWEGLGFGVASTETLQWFVYAIVGFALALIVWRGAQFGVAVWFPAILMGILLTPNPVFAYYLVGALVVAALLFREPFASQLMLAPRGLRWLLVACVVSSLSPILIPAGFTESPAPTIGEGVVISLLPRIAALLWLIYVIAVALAAALRNDRAQRAPTVAED